jgi:hypothetical protein
MKITRLEMGNYMMILGLLLDEMENENCIGKKKHSVIYIRHKRSVWKIEKQ